MRVFGYAQSVKESFSNMSAPMISRENARCAILPISSLLAMLDTIPVWKLPWKRVFGYARHTQSVKESLTRVFGYAQSVKESFSNMSAPMISQENARCAILPISSLLAMLDTIPVWKLPLKRVLGYARHAQSVKESLTRVFGYAQSVKESFSNMSAPMISRENARCVILPILSLLAMIKMIPVLKTPFKESFRLCMACAEC